MCKLMTRKENKWKRKITHDNKKTECNINREMNDKENLFLFHIKVETTESI